MTLDCQTWLPDIGQSYAVMSTNQGVWVDARVRMGLNLQVTPKILPGGKVLIRVIPEVSTMVCGAPARARRICS